jgi:hypothetical protein
VSSDIAQKRQKIALGLAFVLQFGFQIVTLYSLWIDGHAYRPIEPAQFAATGETIRYVRCSSQNYQGEFITPTQGVINCYDNDDFLRVQFAPDAPLVKSINYDNAPMQAAADARFMSWNRIRIELGPESPAAPFTVVLNQAYNAHWSSPQCTVRMEGKVFLAARCTAAREIELVFDDQLSTRAVQVSLMSWRIWSVLFVLCALIGCLQKALSARAAARVG